jgi:peptide deformylase
VSVRQIRYLGDPVLRERSESIEIVNDEIRRLIDDLTETMYEADGVGLAAPQIGVPLRVFVFDVRDSDLPSGALVNPVIVERRGKIKEEEGCLSIPGLSELVERSDSVVVRGLDEKGEEVEIEAEGLLSRCLQHECDHLDGVLFIDHVSPLKRKLLMKKWARREESEHATTPVL